jgi:hypothetical protein
VRRPPSVLAVGADTVTFTLVGFVIVIALVVVWRVLVHDRAIRRIRLGVFYERERDDDPDERHERLPRKDERP